MRLKASSCQYVQNFAVEPESFRRYMHYLQSHIVGGHREVKCTVQAE